MDIERLEAERTRRAYMIRFTEVYRSPNLNTVQWLAYHATESALNVARLGEDAAKNLLPGMPAHDDRGAAS